jgi:hypothetical protein
MTHSCEFENFSSKVLKNGSNVTSCLGSDSHLVLGVVLQETLDTTARELSYRNVSKVKPKKTRLMKLSRESTP